VGLAIQSGKLALRRDAPDSAVAVCAPASLGPVPVGDALLHLRNTLPNPVAMTLRGNTGLIAATSVKAGDEGSVKVALRHAGTMLAELFSPGTSYPLCAAAVVVPEPTPAVIDRDETLLIEEWRVRADGSLINAGTNEGDSSRIFTLNRKLTSDFNIRPHERLRLRFINASPRRVVAVRIENHDLRVIAVDSRPAEPYPALNGQVALAPGSRIDVLLDATGAAGSSADLLLHDGVAPRTLAHLAYGSEPMRNARLPEAPQLSDPNPPLRPDLRRAQRVDLTFDGKANARGWSSAPAAPPVPVFSARRGRTISLALINRTGSPAIFRLNGVHARLLDRLDDGWKPYWMDTVAVDAGQTARLAFVAGDPGQYLIEAFAPVWSAPLFRRMFIVQT
jgi:FtsP/CotA-like multicopper oxidase with cupredoxin domain